MKQNKFDRFFFEGDHGGGTGGAAPSAQQQGQQEQNPQNPQQQQQAPTIPDPFAGMDLDLVDEDTRNRITQAREAIRTTAEQARKNDELARLHQSRHDQLLQGLQRQQQQQPPQQQPLTLEQEIALVYTEQGFTPEQAAAAAKVQAKIMSKVMPNIEKNIGQAVAPYVQNQAQSAAQNAIQQATVMDATGALRDPEVRSKVEQSIANLVDSGKIVTVDLVNQLRNVFAYDKLIAQVQQQQQQPNQMFPAFQQPQPQPQFLQPMQFPSMGASFNQGGPVNRMPQTQGPQLSVLNEDTAKAIAAVNQTWAQQIPGADKLINTNGNGGGVRR